MVGVADQAAGVVALLGEVAEEVAGDLAVATGDEDIHGNQAIGACRLRCDYGPAMRRLLLALVALALLPASAAAAPPLPFGHPCTAQNGTRFCPTTALTDRVASFDGVPLDVDVTLPASGDGPFPTIVMLHGYGGNKTNYEASKPEGDDPAGATTYHWNSNWFARRGYAVVNASARGFGRSCGRRPRARPTARSGWIHLADQRYEARDTQHLLGLLADQGIARPGALGVTGISYGGGQSLELAYLRDRIRNPDGSFAPWRSPGGTPLSIAAAYPRWLWSDLVNALLPNGRFLDFRVSSATESREPIGVPIQSFVSGLYASGAASGFYSPPGVDPGADLTTWFARIQAGEPYGADATRDRRRDPRAPPGLRAARARPAPLLLHGGWTDDLFPSSESLRIYNALRAADPNAPVSLQFADLGHQRGSNKVNADRALNDAGSAFLDAYLRGAGSPPAPGSVTAFTQTCPKGRAAGGPFRAASWPELHPGAVTFGAAAAQTVSSGGGDPHDRAGLRPDLRRRRRVQEHRGGVRARHRRLHRLRRRPLHAARAARRSPPTSRRRARTASSPRGCGTSPRRHADAGHARRLPAHRQPARPRHLPALRQRLPLRARPRAAAPAARPRRALLPREQRLVQRARSRTSAIVLPVAEQPGSVPGVGAPPAQLQALARKRPRLSVRDRLSKRRVLRTTGRLILPRGVSRTRGCRGRVSIRVRARKRTISARRRVRAPQDLPVRLEGPLPRARAASARPSG